jgi:hypothetical protein
MLQAASVSVMRGLCDDTEIQNSDFFLRCRRDYPRKLEVYREFWKLLILNIK